ncbi:MAG: hypothetical protein WBN65_14755, partial [Gammaproteobacteria bacterium]
MKHNLKFGTMIAALAAGLAVFCAIQLSTVPHPVVTDDAARNSYIVQGTSLSAVKSLVAEQGGEITHELGVIRAVAADLTPDQAARLRVSPGIRRLYGNDSVEVAGKGGKSGGGTNGSGSYTIVDTHYGALVNADDVHAMGITGEGIGIAVLDTGLWKHD